MRSLFRPQSLDDDPVFLLRLFYQRFFPYKQYYHWLNYGTGTVTVAALEGFLWRINMLALFLETSQNFTHREFSFTLPSDIYIRYNSFQDIDVMKKEIERLQPVKIDIGAVYSVKACDENISNVLYANTRFNHSQKTKRA